MGALHGKRTRRQAIVKCNSIESRRVPIDSVHGLVIGRGVPTGCR